jgi:hypothetical protein
MKIIDKVVDVIFQLLVKYRQKRKIEELKKRDPFIYR